MYRHAVVSFLVYRMPSGWWLPKATCNFGNFKKHWSWQNPDLNFDASRTFHLLQTSTVFFPERGYSGSLCWHPGNVWRWNLPQWGFGVFFAFPLPLLGLVTLPCGNHSDTKDFKELNGWCSMCCGKSRKHQKLHHQCCAWEMENKYKLGYYFVCFLLWKLPSGNIDSGDSSCCTMPRIFTNTWD